MSFDDREAIGVTDSFDDELEGEFAGSSLGAEFMGKLQYGLSGLVVNAFDDDLPCQCGCCDEVAFSGAVCSVYDGYARDVHIVVRRTVGRCRGIVCSKHGEIDGFFDGFIIAAGKLQ